MDLSSNKTFSEKVVEIARMIPVGRVMTYGQIAEMAGGGAAQSITTILGRAYHKGVTDIPFHRIVYADGRVWLDEIYGPERLKQYKQEGISLDKDNKIINFKQIRL